MQRAELFSTGDTPYQGLKSDRHPLTLGAGDAFNAQNLRCEPGQPISVRNGISEVLDASGLPVNAVFLGTSEPYFYKAIWRFVQAVEDPADNKVHLYVRGYSEATGWDASWTEVTATTGKFGDTRLQLPSEGRISFVWTKAPQVDGTYSYPDPEPMCLVSDGAVVRMVLADASSALGCSHANAIAAPVEAAGQGILAEMRSWLQIPDTTATGTPVGASWTSAGTTGAAGSYIWQWVTSGTITAGHTADITINATGKGYLGNWSSTAYSQSRQIVLIAHSDKASFWDSVDYKIKVDDGSTDTWYETYAAPLVLPTNTANYELIILSIPELIVSLKANLTISGLKLAATSSTPANATVSVYGFATSGQIAGGASFAICRRNTTTQIDSPGVVLSASSFGSEFPSEREKNPGVTNKTLSEEFNITTVDRRPIAAVIPEDFLFPLDSRIYFSYFMNTINPSQDELETNGANALVYYRKDPGETDYYRTSIIHLASYTSSWNLTTQDYGSAIPIGIQDVLPENRDFSDRLPDEFVEPPPPFNTASVANDRAYYGSIPTDTQDCELLISEQGHPLRCRRLVRMDTPSTVDPASGYAIRLTGERTKSITTNSESSAIPNGASVFLFTDKSVYSIDRLPGSSAALFQLRRVEPTGASAGESVIDLNGSLIWLDKDRSVRAFGGNDLTRTFVSDKLDAMPSQYVQNCSAGSMNGRYCLAYPASGATENTRVLVFNASARYWESDDNFPAGKEPQLFLEWRIGGENKLLYWTADGKLFEYAKAGQTTDDGAAISFLLETGEFHNSMFEPVLAQHLGLVGSSVTTTLTTKRIFSEPAATIQGELDLDTGTTLAWKYDQLVGGGTPGGEGQSVRLRVNGDFTESFELLSLVAEVEGAELGGASG